MTEVFLSLVPSSGKHTAKKNAVLRTSRGVRNASHVVDAQRDYHRQARTQMGDRGLLVGPVEVVAEFIGPWAHEGVTVPDLTNIAELVFDAIQKVVIVNDAQIARCTLAKVKGDAVKVWLTVREVK